MFIEPATRKIEASGSGIFDFAEIRYATSGAKEILPAHEL
jgi:hypothetical protein